MNKRRMKKSIFTIIALVLGIPVISIMVTLIRIYIPMVPTTSSSGILKVALYSGGYPNKPLILLKHYVNGLHVKDYTLVIEKGVHMHEPQKYDLPKFNEGMIEIKVNLGDKYKSSFIMRDIQAADLHKKGLLIYLTDNESEMVWVDREWDYGRYIYFVLGNTTICYFRSAHSDEWEIITDAPRLKIFTPRETRKTGILYVGPSGWEENDWVITSYEELTNID